MFAAVLLVILFGTVFAAVHHAEVIAERIGEPYGTLLVTISHGNVTFRIGRLLYDNVADAI